MATFDRTVPTSSRTCVRLRIPASITTGQPTPTSIRTPGSRGRAHRVCTTAAPTALSAGATTGWEAGLGRVHAGKQTPHSVPRCLRPAPTRRDGELHRAGQVPDHAEGLAHPPLPH